MSVESVEDLAKLIAFWHGQKMLYRDRDGMQTVASSHGFGHYGDSTDRYMHAHWQEYVSAAEIIWPMLAEPITGAEIQAASSAAAEKANGGKFNDPMFYNADQRHFWEDTITAAFIAAGKARVTFSR